jgi:Protein of unknown function (DUF3631)
MGGIDGAQVLDDLENFYVKYVYVRRPVAIVLAAWVLHCHAFSAFTRTPYVHVTSPVPDCGKTTLLELTELLVPNPWLTSSLSNAVLARTIDRDQPVLLLDEMDELQKGDKELFAAVTATINSGYKKSGRRSILVPAKGGDWHVKHLSTFSPKILSGLSRLAAVTQSRCIPVVMERLGPSDRVAEMDEYVTEPEAAALYARASDWAKQKVTVLRDARPCSPTTLGPRQREVCRPLFAVADSAGGDWPEKVRAAVLELFGSASSDGNNVALQLLADIRQLVELVGIEPTTSSLRTMRSPS